MKAIFFYSFLFLIKFSVAQTPVIVRPTNPNVLRVPKEIKAPSRQINTPTTPIEIGVFNKEVFSYFTNMFSLLQFSNYIGGGKEFPTYWESSKTSIHEIYPESPKTKNWKKTFTWRKIPAGTAFGLWQISTLPFALTNDPNFTGVIRSGEIKTNGADSVYFEINYTDDTNMESREKFPGLRINKKNIPIQIKKTPITTNDLEEVALADASVNNNQKLNTRVQNNTMTTNEVAQTTIIPSIDLPKSKFKVFGDGTRKFYIRLIPLDATRKLLEKISNEVV